MTKKKVICFNCGKELKKEDHKVFLYFRNTEKKLDLCWNCWATLHVYIYRKGIKIK